MGLYDQAYPALPGLPGIPGAGRNTPFMPTLVRQDPNSLDALIEKIKGVLGPEPQMPAAPEISVDSPADMPKATPGWPGPLEETPRQKAERLGLAGVMANANANAAAIRSQANVLGAKEEAAKALAQILSEAPPPQTAYTPPAPVSRQNIEFPRSAALPRSTTADVVAALAAVLNPAIAGQAGTSVYDAMKSRQGELDAQNKERFGYDVNRADQAYQDAAANRAEQIRFALMNRDVDYQNALRAFQAKQAGKQATVDLPVMEAQRTGLNESATTIPDIAKALYDAQTTGQNVERMDKTADEEKKREMDLYKDAINAYRADVGARKSALTGAMMYDRGINTANISAGARQYDTDVNAAIKAALGGFQLNPNSPMLPPIPSTPGQRSAKQNAEIDLAKARASHLRDQVAAVRAGKAADLSKATPEERVALQNLTGARNDYLKTKQAWQAFSTQIQVKGLDQRDPDVHKQWDALRLQTEQAAKQYQAADAEAHRLIAARSAQAAAPAAPQGAKPAQEAPVRKQFVDKTGKAVWFRLQGGKWVKE